MGNVLSLLKNEEVINFQLGLGSLNMGMMGDTLFPDTKTKNLKAKYYELSDGQQIPVMASVHAFDTEAKIGRRPVLEQVSVEKFLVKEKINLSENEREYLDNGVTEASDLISYIFNDFGHLARKVKTRVEVAKMELLYSGKITIKENKLNYTIDFGMRSGNTFNHDWSANTADILGDIQAMITQAKSKGQIITNCVTTTPIVMAICKNKAIQKAIFGANGEGIFTPLSRVNELFAGMFGFTIAVNDELYRYDAGTSIKQEYYIPRNKFILYSALPNGAAGACIWGVTPEERQQGVWTEKSSQQFITLTGWATTDPVAEWYKASGLAVPMMPNRDGHLVADVKLA